MTPEQQQGPSRLAARLFRSLALLIGVFLAVGCFELGLRFARPDLLESAGRVSALHPGSPLHPVNGLYVLDSELVYRPGPNNPDFGPHGALVNDYPLAKQEGVQRVLFVGDSVVQRESVTQAFRDAAQDLARDVDVEFWSLGVEGYDTFQELELFRRYGAALQPDQVVLFYSHNDTRRTPIFFYDEQGDLLRFRSNKPRKLNPWLLRWSYLYRFAIASPPRPTNHGQALIELMEPMRELRNLVEAKGGQFTVLVQPLLLEPGFVEGSLEQLMYQRHGHNLEVMRTAEMTVLDLAIPVRRALEQEVVLSEAPGDVHHPSAELSAIYAQWSLTETDLRARSFSAASTE